MGKGSTINHLGGAWSGFSRTEFFFWTSSDQFYFFFGPPLIKKNFFLAKLANFFSDFLWSILFIFGIPVIKFFFFRDAPNKIFFFNSDHAPLDD